MSTPSTGAPRPTIYFEQPSSKPPIPPVSPITTLATAKISPSSSSSSSSSRPFPISRLPGRALELIASSTGEPHVLRNVSTDCRVRVEKTSACVAARRRGLDPLVGYTIESARAASSSLTRLGVPFAIEGDDPAHVAIAEKIFQRLYSKEHFGTGREACSFVLDSFAQLTRPRAFGQLRVVIEELPANIWGQFAPFKHRLVINKSKVSIIDSGFIKLEDRFVQELMGTMLHEMTHAIHHAAFTTFHDTSNEEALQRELGCTTKEFETELRKAADNVPSGIGRHGILLCGAETFSLYNKEIRPIFVVPADHVRSDELAIGFSEFLARFPEIYCIFGKTHTKPEIDAALKRISPLAYRIFWGQFRERSEQLAKVPLSEDALGELGDAPQRMLADLSRRLVPWDYINRLAHASFLARIASERMDWVTYRNDDEMLCLQTMNPHTRHLWRAEIDESLRKGCHHMALTDPYRIAFSTKFLQTYETLSKKPGAEGELCETVFAPLARELGHAFRADAEKEASRNKIPPILSGPGVLDSYRDSARRIFEMLYEHYKPALKRDPFADPSSETLAIFTRLTGASDDGVPMDHRVTVEIVNPAHDVFFSSSSPLFGLKPAASMSKWRTEGSGFYVIHPAYSNGRPSRLIISTDFLREFEREAAESEKTGTQSKELTHTLSYLIGQMDAAILNFNKTAPHSMAREHGGLYNCLNQHYFRRPSK